MKYKNTTLHLYKRKEEEEEDGVVCVYVCAFKKIKGKNRKLFIFGWVYFNYVV